ncbi:hypothetical protein [Arthrospiribacter ruber]|uniref:Uncharacterized protein n=1 Tax=Arthrospiribacter ruber TaxID=2487934 RepID=A0A951MEH2_9BACT|nr:hypothetical protein [Arthrospiribacter ruber]MBW3469659.1 hypothetical protein [Arthrospiribacter ruber]
MGFIPIIATLSAAIFLFFMTVNYSLNAKKEKMLRLQKQILEALASLGLLGNPDQNLSSEQLIALKSIFQVAKSKLQKDNATHFSTKVQEPYRELKITLLQYNNIISKKPYSFVAKAMGHQKLELN